MYGISLKMVSLLLLHKEITKILKIKIFINMEVKLWLAMIVMNVQITLTMVVFARTSIMIAHAMLLKH